SWRKSGASWEAGEMCVIVDAILASSVFSSPPNEDFRPLLRWLLDPDEDGCLIFGGYLAAELARVGDARRALRTLRQAGRAKLADEVEVTRVAAQLAKVGF